MTITSERGHRRERSQVTSEAFKKNRKKKTNRIAAWYHQKRRDDGNNEKILPKEKTYLQFALRLSGAAGAIARREVTSIHLDGRWRAALCCLVSSYAEQIEMKTTKSGLRQNVIF